MPLLSDQTVDKISGAIGISLVGVFVLGLAWSISTGFAGFWGGLPFWIISVTILVLIAVDFWTSCVRAKK
jgi:hypothetical protein